MLDLFVWFKNWKSFQFCFTTATPSATFNHTHIVGCNAFDRKIYRFRTVWMCYVNYSLNVKCTLVWWGALYSRFQILLNADDSFYTNVFHYIEGNIDRARGHLILAQASNYIHYEVWVMIVIHMDKQFHPPFSWACDYLHAGIEVNPCW